MTRFVAVDIAEGTVQLFQRDLNPAFDVGNIIPAQHNQRAMAGAAFGVAGSSMLTTSVLVALTASSAAMMCGPAPVRAPRMPIER